MRKKVIVLVPDYRDVKRPYSNAFVHTRVKAYLLSGLEVKVFVLNGKRAPTAYSIDGVDVIVGDDATFENFVEEFNCNTINVHFLDDAMCKLFLRIKKSLNLIIVVHGDEALHWYKRLFPGWLSNFRLFLGTIHGAFLNSKRIHHIRNFIKNNIVHKVTFIAVSKWMMVEAEKTWKCSGKLQWSIIPNYINSNMFCYTEKKESDRLNLLSIRPFINGKYANDVTAKVLKTIDENNVPGVRMKWVGAGVLYRQNTKKVKKLSFVSFENRMLQQEELPDYYRSYGVFICPTRQDAQGVSMCEAMSSGLVPITLYNTAIPEFLPDDRLICNNSREMFELILKLINNKELFFELSRKCSSFIQEKCSYENTIMKEIEILNGR